MQTDKIHISELGEGAESLLDSSERYADYMKLGKKSALQLRLLCEETLGMLKEIVGTYDADIWIESNGDETEIHAELQTEMDREKRAKLLGVSSTGKNFLAKGIMGKIREVVELSLMEENISERMTDYDILQMGYANMPYDSMSMSKPFAGAYVWSLANYKNTIDEGREDDDKYKEAWDELEKSIIANIADDVKIGIKDYKVKMIISKKF